MCAAMSILAANYPDLMDSDADGQKRGDVSSHTRPQQQLITPFGTSCNSMWRFSIFARGSIKAFPPF